MHDNFWRIHPLRKTPSMGAGNSDHVWSVEKLCGLLHEVESATKTD